MLDQDVNTLGRMDPSFIELHELFMKHQTSCESYVYLLQNKYHVDSDVCDGIKRRCMITTTEGQRNPYPKISIVIPTYNRLPMLLECVESVLAQTYLEKEIIVVDDCSSDDTQIEMNRLIARHTNVKYIRNQVNKNAGLSRNIGFLAATGEYIVFLDDDDFYIDPHFFDKAIARHLANPNLAFVAGNAEMLFVAQKRFERKKLNTVGYIERKDFIQGFMRTIDKPLSTFTSVFDKKKLDKAGCKEMRMMNDASIYLRSFLVGDAEIIEDIIGVYRLHATNISNRLSAQFVIENLDEKVFIFRSAKESSLIVNDTLWLDEQLKTTIHYWISSSQPDLKSTLEIIKWNWKKNLGSKFSLSWMMVRSWMAMRLKP